MKPEDGVSEEHTVPQLSAAEDFFSATGLWHSQTQPQSEQDDKSN